MASGSRNAGLVAAVSLLALIIMAAPDISFAHKGTKPHHIRDNSPWFLWVLADHRNRLGWCDVIAGCPDPVLLNKLFPTRQPGASAHRDIINRCRTGALIVWRVPLGKLLSVAAIFFLTSSISVVTR